MAPPKILYPLKKGSNRDPNIGALKRKGFTHPGSTLYFPDPCMGSGYVFFFWLQACCELKIASNGPALSGTPEVENSRYELESKLLKGVILYVDTWSLG